MMPYEARGIATKMGWKRRRAGDVFEVVIVFPDGPPQWPLATVWNRWPITLSVQAPGDAAAEVAHASTKETES